MDFETARENLETWYRLGHPNGDRAFAAYFNGWLSPAVERAARRIRLSDHERNDQLQEIALHFSDRTRTVGTNANSAALWHTIIKNRLQDYLKKRARLSREQLAQQPDDNDDVGLFADPTADLESQLCERDADAYRRSLFIDFLPHCTPREQRALVCYTWPLLREIATPEIINDLAQQCGLTPAQVCSTLDAAVAFQGSEREWVRRTVMVFRGQHNNQTLDDYRQARSLAVQHIRHLAAARLANRGQVR